MGTHMVAVRFGSYNLLSLFASESPEERQRYESMAEVIRGLNVDILAVQELTGSDGAIAGARLRALARATGMECRYESQPAIAIGSQGFHVGLLWRPGLDLVPGSLRRFGGGDFWHSLVVGTFDLDGHRIQHASHHATPFGRGMRADQMELVVTLLTRPTGQQPPTLVGADWNTIGADRLPDGSFYDHDPYDAAWFPDLIFHTDWDYDAAGNRSHRADRRPADILSSGGLHDAAAVLKETWEPTTGHWFDDPYPERRIDAVRVTGDVVPALQRLETIRTDLTCRASDHLPIVATYETDLLPTPPNGRSPE